ncbi:phosphatase [Sporanaerobium hydrogeniformans]|uniref:Phosphatase n=1 Tax=Sporanaerobium hydrogeniformans TaxID=3072179 RepID=A0AC61DGJ0_9FIRM|nr:phosphatase [Sporanaerobium hydrogeniformans]PHV71938.1 phosphatase [Sporanaerobium hydrogeniformans]
MKLVADTHVHTLASGHAYSTVDEIVRQASEIGLEALAITDHTSGMPGGAHDFHFMNLKVIPKYLHGVRILKGAEVNIVDYEGHVDASKEVMETVELVIASLHPPCIPFADKETVTTGLERIMENPLIQIIGHPGDGRYPFDANRLARKAKETGTLLEINNASLKPTSFRPGVRENLILLLEACKAYGTHVVVATDSHFYTEVGQWQESLTFLEQIDFPEELVINTHTDHLLAFISQKRLK